MRLRNGLSRAALFVGTTGSALGLAELFVMVPRGFERPRLYGKRDVRICGQIILVVELSFVAHAGGRIPYRGSGATAISRLGASWFAGEMFARRFRTDHKLKNQIELSYAKKSQIGKTSPSGGPPHLLLSCRPLGTRAITLRVLYVTDRWDAPYRYRCQHACEQLRGDGVVANVAHVEDPGLLESLESYSVVVLFRLPWRERVEAIVDTARRLGIPIVFDVDDLVFDPVSADLMTFRSRYSDTEWRESYGRYIDAVHRTFQMCDLFVGSTPALAERAAQLGKAAVCHPNVVPRTYLRSGERVRRARRWLRKHPTIGYFSGSNTHDEDFNHIGGALLRVLRERPGTRLVIGGFLDIGADWPELEQQIVRLPHVHWSQYGWALGLCHVTIAPLATHNLFTDSKSALKFFEAGAFYVPTVATPVREMARAIRHDVDGWLAETEDEWARALHQALDDSVADVVGERARQKVARHYSPDAYRGDLRAHLESVAISPYGAPPRATSITPRDATNTVSQAPHRLITDFGHIVRAAREAPPAAVDYGRIRAWLESIAKDDTARRRFASQDAEIFVTDAENPWRTNEHLALLGDLPGEQRASGTDPHWLSPELGLNASRFRYAAFRIRTASTRVARGHLYWRVRGASLFDERASCAFAVPSDGTDRWHILDLHRGPGASEWKDADIIETLRLDPLDGPGEARLGVFALLSEAFVQRLSSEPPVSPPAMRKVTQSDPDRKFLRRVISDLAPGERLELIAEIRPRRLRQRLLRALNGAAAIVESIERIGGSTRVVLRKTKQAAFPPVDIVVPVYGAREFTLRCLDSVITHARGDFRLVVIDDASPDLQLKADLEEFARKHARTILLRNPDNLGFVRTSNRGMRHAGDRDVLLLNSDTVVFRGFLSRLQRAAYAERRTGVVCPFSNNATICSVPQFCRHNSVPEGMTATDFAALVSAVSLRERPELVTPHGFCMYMRADFLRDVGHFDETLFGKGFGEENDLGERARHAGWKTRLADDVYVWHEGKASFGKAGEKLESQHGDVLERRHPGYRARVAEFVRKNPLREVQENLDWHIARGSGHIGPAPLFLVHANPFGEEPGGVEHCIRDLVQALELPRAVLVYPASGGIGIAEVIRGRVAKPLLYQWPLQSAVPRFSYVHQEAAYALSKIVKLFRVGWVHVHHLMYWPCKSILDALVEAGLPFVVTCHDFYAGCPSFNLLDFRTTTVCCPESCGDRARTAACMRALFPILGLDVPAEPAEYVEHHRRAFTRFLQQADAVLFPSESAKDLLCRILPLSSERCRVVPHGYDLPKAANRPRANERLRIALVGEIAYASKGAEAYLRTIELCKDLDVEWHIFGRVDRFGFDKKLSQIVGEERVVLHGGYTRDTIVRLLAQSGADLGVLLPAWPETFSYTLSEMLCAGVPVIAKRIGALENRLEGRPYGVLVGGAEEAARTIAALRADRVHLDALQAAAQAFVHEATLQWADQHRAIYDRCAARIPESARESVRKYDLQKLNELRTTRGAQNLDAATNTTQPASHLITQWWYPYAERLKAHFPESVRQVVRRRLAADGARDVRRWRLPGRGVTVGADLLVDKKYVGTTRFRALNGDPHLLIDVDDLEPAQVQAIRFNLWCSQFGYAFAQVYWRHAGDQFFSEDNSVSVVLNGQASAWLEYVIRLDSHERARSWYEGGPIVELRFDPINLPGYVALGELALCRVNK